MKCTCRDVEVTIIRARHEYTIRYDEEQGKWVKEVGDVIYSCGHCLEGLDVRSIDDILRQVDEL